MHKALEKQRIFKVMLLCSEKGNKAHSCDRCIPVPIRAVKHVLSEAFKHLKILFFKNTYPYRFLSSTVYLKTPSTKESYKAEKKKTYLTTTEYYLMTLLRTNYWMSAKTRSQKTIKALLNLSILFDNGTLNLRYQAFFFHHWKNCNGK